MVLAVPSLQDRRDGASLDVADVGHPRAGGMRHGARDELGKVGVGYERAGRGENQGGAVFSGALRIDEIAEIVELEIGGDNAAHVPPHRSAHGDHRGAVGEGEIGCRNQGPVGRQRVPIPGSLSRIVAISPEIDLLNLIALFVFENPPERQFAVWKRID